MLAWGGAPAWLDWIAATILWALVSVVYFCFAVGLSITLFPAPPEVKGMGPLDWAKRQRGHWGKRYAGRLAALLFVLALFVSGRPILAGLYFLAPFIVILFEVRYKRYLSGVDRPDVSAGQWAVYRAFCFPAWAAKRIFRLLYHTLKWLVWVPLVFAMGACLRCCDVRIGRRLRESLGLPRALAGFLYGAPWWRIWRQVLPSGLWLVVLGLSLGLAFGVVPMATETAIIVTLWAAALALLMLFTLSFLFVVFVEDGGQIFHGSPPVGWPRALRPYAHFLLRLVFLSALCVAGHWILAGLYLLLICVISAMQWWDAVPGEQDDEISNPSIIAGGIGLCFLVGVLLVLVSPVLLPILAHEYWCKFRIAKGLRSQFDRPEGLIYFLHSELHQYEHFLGEGGVLAAYRDKTVARNWRMSVHPKREGPGWEDFEDSAEGRLLKQFEISRLRHHLPFVAVVPPGPWLKGFQMSEAYRARRRDSGAAIGKLENEIKKAASKTFRIAAT